MNGRLFIVIVLSLLAGLVIGRMAPQAQLRRMTTALEQAKTEPSKRRSADASVQSVRSLLNVANEDVEKAGRIRRAKQLMTNEATTTTVSRDPEYTNQLSSPATKRQEIDIASLSNSINQLEKGWTMRIELARNNFIKKAELDEPTTAHFDVLMEAMNFRLGASVDTWVDRLKQQGSINEEAGVRMLNELSDILVLTYDEMDRKMPNGWREKIGPKFDLVRFVDPEVLTPLQDIEHLQDLTSELPDDK